MYAIVFLAFFVLIAVVSLFGWTADSRDLSPRLPLQAPGQQPDARSQEPVTRTALPPQPRWRAHAR
jgi:hypothetical protein